MKKLVLFSLTTFIIQFSVFCQLEPIGWKKLCLGERVSAVFDLKCKNNIVINKLNYGSELIGIDATTDEIVWQKNYGKMYYVGYGLVDYGDNLMFYSSANTMDAKDKVVQATWIITMNPDNGNKIDSSKCNFSIVSIADSPGKSGVIGMIKMGSDNKYSAALVTKSTGLVKFDLLKESTSLNGNPNTIKIDASEKYAAVGCANGKAGFYLYDFLTGKKLLSLPGEGDIMNIDFSSDSKYCFYMLNKKLNIINIESLKLEKQIALANAGVHVTVHSDNENLVITGMGTKVQVVFLNWKTEKVVKSDLATAGGVSDFNENGDLYLCQTNYVLDCTIDKVKMPYLAKFTFKNSTNTIDIPVDNSTSNTSGITNTSTFNQGTRVYIYYSADKKFYSGTITEETSAGYNVVYDDGTKSTAKKEDVKALPEIRIGENVQARRSDKKSYVGTVLAIKGQVVQLKFSATITEWIPMRDIMQMEDKK